MRFDVAGASAYAYTGSRPLAAEQPTVVFVHGAANDHTVWALQSRYLAHHGWNALAVDLPGHGRSCGPALGSIDALAGWLVGVLDALSIGRAAFVGHSMGSLAVLELAARFPLRASAVALLGTAFPMRVADALLDAAKADDHTAFELINGWAFAPSKQMGGNRNPGLWLVGNSMRLMERSRPGVLHTDLCACNTYANGLVAAAAIACPALLVVGAQDLMAPPRAARSLAQTIPGARTVTLDNCGHVLMSEQPDRVLDELRAFLPRV